MNNQPSATQTFNAEAFAQASAAELLNALCSGGFTVSTAESITGGLTAKLLTDPPGASEVFVGGAVTYVNAVKNSVLSVSSKTLDEFGAVSEQCAKEMALGAKRLFHSDFAVSITGFAGPAVNGGTDDGKVGLVYIAVATPDGGITASKLNLIGNRDEIRLQAATAAITTLCDKI